MKKNLFVRILAALGGLVLILLSLSMLAETFFAVPVTAWVGRVLGDGSPLVVLMALLAAIVLCIFGVCCVMMLSGKRSGKRRGFVMQKGENGAIGVSIKSIEGLVHTCVKQHDMVAAARISVAEKRDGIIILLDIQEAAGVNIPLAVGALQKQIREYVNTCTGVDVHEVRVMVENTEDAALESPYAVQAPVVPVTAATAEMLREAPAAQIAEVPAETVPVMEIPEEAVPAEDLPVLEIPQAEEAPALQETAPVPVQVAAPPIPALPEIIADEDERPLHQRLFGAEDEPVFVPMPPEMSADPAAEEAAAEAAPEAEPIREAAEETPEDALDANAVLDVVNAMAEEELNPEETGEEAAAEEIPAEAEDELPKE